MYKCNHITVVIPALNEEQSIKKVVSELIALRDEQGQKVIDDIIVCDNGSTDETANMAIEAGARVVFESRQSYGYACLRALSAISHTDIVLFIDADHAFFAEQSIALLEPISQGAGMVIGSRVLGNIEPKSLTSTQKMGNQLATFLIHKIWHHRYSDLGPFRAIRWSHLKQLDMRDTGYGWTVEMQVKAIWLKLSITEVPVDTRVRIGTSKISGTVKGVFKAGVGIISMIFKLRWQQRKTIKKYNNRIIHKKYVSN